MSLLNDDDFTDLLRGKRTQKYRCLTVLTLNHCLDLNLGLRVIDRDPTMEHETQVPSVLIKT